MDRPTNQRTPLTVFTFLPFSLVTLIQVLPRYHFYHVPALTGLTILPFDIGPSMHQSIADWWIALLLDGAVGELLFADFADWFIDCVIGWWVNWSIRRLMDSSIYGLIDWFCDFLTHYWRSVGNPRMNPAHIRRIARHHSEIAGKWLNRLTRISRNHCIGYGADQRTDAPAQESPNKRIGESTNQRNRR